MMVLLYMFNYSINSGASALNREHKFGHAELKSYNVLAATVKKVRVVVFVLVKNGRRRLEAEGFKNQI